MTTELDTTRAVREWLRDGVSTLPDRVLDAVIEEVPTTRQRRRVPWGDTYPGETRRSWMLAATLAAMLALLTASLLIAAGAMRLVSPAPVREQFLFAGSVPIRITVDVRDGWQPVDVGASYVQIAEPGRASSGDLLFTTVTGIYFDPCHSDLGLAPPLGSSPDNLALALSRLTPIQASERTSVTVGGHPATALTLTAPNLAEDCVTGEPPYLLWGVPQPFTLDPGDQATIRIVDIEGTRLVVVARVPNGADPAAEAHLADMVGSITLDPLTAADRATPAPPSESMPPIRELPVSGPIPPDFYVFDLQLHEYDAQGRSRPLPYAHSGSVQVPVGWFATGNGIANDAAQPSPVRLSWWTVDKLYVDPCRWQSTDPAPPWSTRYLDGLAGALSSPWIDLGSGRGGFEGPANVPSAAQPLRFARNARFAWSIELSVPSGVDASACDGGEYRLWEDHTGAARTAQAGERIDLWVLDLEPGLAVLEVGWLPGAPQSTVDAAREMRDTMWFGSPDEIACATSPVPCTP